MPEGAQNPVAQETQQRVAAMRLEADLGGQVTQGPPALEPANRLQSRRIGLRIRHADRGEHHSIEELCQSALKRDPV